MVNLKFKFPNCVSFIFFLFIKETKLIKFIKTYLSVFGYKEIKPEEVGALTSAPLITDGKDVWGYMDYALHAFVQELMMGVKIVWQKG